MSKLALLTSGTGVSVGAGAAVIAALGAGAYFSGAFTTDDTAPLPQSALIAPNVEAPEAAKPNQEESTAPVAEDSRAPQFDIVRVETSGEAMIAGQAKAGETVEIRLDDTVVAQATAGNDGTFASFVTLPSSPDARVLTLDVKGGEIGREQVIVAPVPESAAQAQPTVTEPAQAEITEEKPAPAILLASEGEVRVLQAPDAPKPEAMTSLLGAISYDEAGVVALTGRGTGSFVRVYLDNAPITSSRIAANGDWRVGLPSVDTGVYTLRVDELNADGDVLARVETPFKREASEVLQAASVPGKAVQAITVQPGATLWAIAQERYGSGTLYTRVFEANSDAIRDPDMIFPGQVFNIPD